MINLKNDFDIYFNNSFTNDKTPNQITNTRIFNNWRKIKNKNGEFKYGGEKLKYISEPFQKYLDELNKLGNDKFGWTISENTEPYKMFFFDLFEYVSSGEKVNEDIFFLLDSYFMNEKFEKEPHDHYKINN